MKKQKLDSAGPPLPNEQLKRPLGKFNPDDIPVKKVNLFLIFINLINIILCFVWQPQTNGVEKLKKPITNERVNSSPEQDHSQFQGEWTRL